MTVVSIEQLPTYESPDDIPIHEIIVPPINMEGLPSYNFIHKVMNCLGTTSDTYQEYAMQAAFVMLSATVRRRMYVVLNDDVKYPVVWMIILGPSGYARKSVSLSKARKILARAHGKDILVADDVTPEGLIEALATQTKHKLTTKTGVIWNDLSERFADGEDGKIIRSQRAYIRDETSQLYAQMNQPGKDWLEQLFLKLHGGHDYEKSLVSKKQLIEEPFFPMLGATTPEGFKKYMTKENIRSGFLARQLITSPTYPKQRKGLRENSEDDDAINVELVADLKLIDSVLGKADNSIRAGFQAGALEMLDEWCAEREAYYVKRRDDDHGAFIPRFQENAISMAILIELGNIPFIIRENKNVKLKSLNVSKASMGFALKLIDTVFAPYIDALGLNEESLGTFENGDMAKVERLLRKNKKLDYSTIARNTKIKGSALGETMTSLEQAGAVEFCQCKSKPESKKYATWCVYIPPELNNDMFTNDYSKLPVPAYIQDMKFEEGTTSQLAALYGKINAAQSIEELVPDVVVPSDAQVT